GEEDDLVNAHQPCCACLSSSRSAAVTSVSPRARASDSAFFLARGRTKKGTFLIFSSASGAQRSWLISVRLLGSRENVRAACPLPWGRVCYLRPDGRRNAPNEPGARVDPRAPRAARREQRALGLRPARRRRELHLFARVVLLVRRRPHAGARASPRGGRRGRLP